jgi:hypothetical protein
MEDAVSSKGLLHKLERKKERKNENRYREDTQKPVSAFS